jgi:hypothetical protein
VLMDLTWRRYIFVSFPSKNHYSDFGVPNREFFFPFIQHVFIQ